MAWYIATVEAYTNVTPNTLDSFINLAPLLSPAVTIRIRRLSVSAPGAPASTEFTLRCQVTRKTTNGTGYTMGSGVPVSPLEPPTGTSAYLKTAGVAYALTGTTAVVRSWSVNQRTTYEWIAAFPEEMPECSPGQLIGLDISSSGNSIVLRAEMEWEE